MLRPRNVIIGVFVIAAVSILWAVFDLMQPPDSGGRRSDSYGTRYHGYKALYDILRELKVPVDRGLAPPTGFTSNDTTIVLINPDPYRVSVEPGYLRELAAWVAQGGHVIVSPGGYDTSEFASAWNMPAEEISVLEALGLEGVNVVAFKDEQELRAQEAKRPIDARVEQGTVSTPAPAAAANPFGKMSVSTAIEKRLVECEGKWASLNSSIKWMQLPSDNLQIIGRPEEESGTMQPVARAYVLGADNEKYTIAEMHKIGDGDVVVLSDSRILKNYLVFQQDNPVLIAHIFASPGRRLVFDEFYHNLTVRGNPAWLLTQHPYGLLAMLTLLACGIWIARASNRLGPALGMEQANRRTVGEYVDAVASLFNRGKAHDFVLSEVRNGTVWSIAKELRLAPRSRNEETVLRVLGRRDAARADLLRRALLETDVVLREGRSMNRRVRRKAIVESARKLTACL